MGLTAVHQQLVLHHAALCPGQQDGFGVQRDGRGLRGVWFGIQRLQNSTERRCADLHAWRCAAFVASHRHHIASAAAVLKVQLQGAVENVKTVGLRD